MAKNREVIKKERKRKRRKRILIWTIVPLLVLLLSVTVYGAFLYSKAESVMDKSYNPIDRDSKRETTVDPDIDNISILFIGVDDSEVRNFDSGSRSDALMLATFNEKAKSVKLLSIPRDSYVYIPALGYEDKITHAHANGGVKSTIETVEGFLDIPVDYYVKMNFNAFIDVVDSLGGIEAEVPYAISEKDSEDRHNAINLQPGFQELDGEEALALARTRKQDNDIERGKRQQEILKAIVKKAVNVQALSKYDDVMEAVGDNMSTDLSFDEMKALIDYASAGTSLQIDTLTLKGFDDYVGEKYVYGLDEEALKQTILELKVHLQIADDTETQTYEQNLAQTEETDEDTNY